MELQTTKGQHDEVSKMRPRSKHPSLSQATLLLTITCEIDDSGGIIRGRKSGSGG